MDIEKLGVTVMGVEALSSIGSTLPVPGKVPKLLPRLLTSTASVVAVGTSRA